jgi:hypothetical protein
MILGAQAADELNVRICKLYILTPDEIRIIEEAPK